MIRAAALLLALAATASPATADPDLYRALSCAAPPGEECTRPALHWPRGKTLSVALTRIDDAFLGRPKLRAGAALSRAISALNAANFGLTLIKTNSRADIELILLDQKVGSEIPNTDPPATLRKTTLLLAHDTGTGLLSKARIYLSSDLPTAHFEAEILAALTRAMGLDTRVTGRPETGVLTSISPPKTLSETDREMLRTHYAAPHD
ncbi:MAG: hypothetical protein CR993_02000 [Rhodobacterales bacterium]|nr:MAG: hypothetical protein CR993_02000 [Rhodobacterales bacterium]